MNVLVADDSHVTRHVLTSTLVRCGHRVTALGDGAEAWDAFRRFRFPLVVLDWQMPELDGLEVCRRIRTAPEGADVFVLMITGRDAAANLRVALAAGVDDYMTKPVVPADLEARVRIAERRIGQTLARRTAENALAEAQRLAGIGEVTLALQHEINNPLMGLLATAQLLALDEEVSAETRNQAASILAEARRIADVVRRLRELKEAGSVEYVAGAKMTDLSLEPRRCG